MPVFLNADGSLDVYTQTYVDPSRTQVWASGNAHAAFSTCESLAQLPDYSDHELPPVAVLEVYGASDTVQAFALLGWLRGRALSIIDAPMPKEPITDRYVTPRKQRTFKIHHGVVTEQGVVQTPAPSAPVAASPAGPELYAEPAPKDHHPRVWTDPRDVVMRKNMLPRLSPEARAVFRNMPDHRWVGRSVQQVMDVLNSKRTTRGFSGDLYRFCWVPTKQPYADDSVAV